MLYLRQFCIILFVSFLGELLHAMIPFPIPASVYGLILMLLALCTGILKLKHVRETAGFLMQMSISEFGSPYPPVSPRYAP